MTVAVQRLGDPDGAPDALGTDIAVLREVTLLDGRVVTVVIADGVVVTVEQGSDAEPEQGEGPGDRAVLDATGWMLVPAPCEPHAHLDKALTADRMDPGAGLDLVGAVQSWQELSITIDGPDIRARALDALGRYLEHGITTIRTHVDVGHGERTLESVRTLVALREELADVLTLQVCLLAGHLTPDDVLEEAVEAGIDVIGGCPHLGPEPSVETTRLLALAERTGLPVDLHTDEQVDASELDIVDLAEQVLARGLTQPVTASHCVRLGSLPPEQLRPVLDVVARAGVAVVTLPITNLYLQAWDSTHLPPRGLTAVRAVLDAGIVLGAGADNLRDPFNPVGSADPFETTSLLVTAAHLRPDEALDAVTRGARAAIGLGPADAIPAAEASFVLVPRAPLGDVVAGAVDARVVVHRGKVVADTRVRRASALRTRSCTPHPAPALISGR